MRGSLLALGCLLGATVSFACGDAAPRTQILLVVDGDTDVRTYSEGLSIEVRGATAADPTTLALGTVVDVADDRLVWPVSLGIIPKGNDASRRFDVTIVARDSADGNVGVAVATARVNGNFVAGETRVLRLRLEGACLGVACPDETQTCAGGACTSAGVVTSMLPRYSSADAGTGPTDPTGELTRCRENGLFVSARAYRTDGDADGYCVGAPSNRCAATVQPFEVLADTCSERDDCDDASDTTLGALQYRMDGDGDGFCVGEVIGYCDAAIPTGMVPVEECVGTGTSVADCDDADAANGAQRDYKLDGDGDGSCVGEVVTTCPGLEPASHVLTEGCRTEVDCDDANASVYGGLEVRTDADNDGFCVGAVMSICAASTPPAGTRLPNTCRPLDDCNDAATTSTSYGQACDAGCGTIQCNGACSTSGHGGACDAGCGTIQCNGTCSTSGHGGACDNGCGTIQCNGSCSTSGHGGACDYGCGIIQCNGSCSTSGHGVGQCDAGCGTRACNGSCSTAGHGAGQCDAGCGYLNCNGSCTTAGHGAGQCDSGCGYLYCNNTCSQDNYEGTPICGCGQICQETRVSASLAVGWGYCSPQKTGTTDTVYCTRGRPIYCSARFEAGFNMNGTCPDQGDGTCRYYTGLGEVDALWNGTGCYVYVRAFNCEATTVRAEITCSG